MVCWECLTEELAVVVGHGRKDGGAQRVGIAHWEDSPRRFEIGAPRPKGVDDRL